MSNKPSAMVSEGAKAARIRHRLEGMCVKTMVLTSPNRLESDAATGKEKAERTPDQKKKRLPAESDRSNRSKNQKAKSDWTTNPPAKASRLNSAASLYTIVRDGPSACARSCCVGGIRPGMRV